MKKALLLLIVALISQTANAKIWIVDKDSTNYLPSVQVALDSANVNGGDTIMVFGSATSYGNLIITFPVVLIGEGMNNIYGDNTRFNTIEIYSSDVHISGVISSFVLQCSYAPGDSLGNVIIERCKIQGSISFYGNPCVLTVGCTGPYAMLYDTYIRNNLIEGTISLHSWNTQGAKLIFDTLVFENNIISSGFVRYFYEENLLGCETIIIRHNNFINGPPSVFLGSGNGVLPLNDVEVSENIFYGSNPNNCDSCKFLNNLTFGNGSNDTIITTGVNSGNIIANTTDTIFVNYSGGPFNFNQDFNVHASSPAIGAGIGGDTIGTFGGNYPLGVGEGARLPYLETIHLSNFAYLQSQDFFLNLSARARRNFNDIEILQEIKYSFDSIYPFGQGTTLPFNAGLNVSYSDSIPFSVLDSGLHTITFIARDSKGAYSFPRTYPFNVCTYNEVEADFNLYQSGRDVILDADFKNVLSSLWDFGDGQTSTQQQNSLVHHFDSAAYYTINLNNSNPCFSSSSSKSIFISGINTVSPTNGGVGGIVTMTITGAGFNDSVIVRLRDASGANIIPSIDSSTIVTYDNFIRTAFNLNGATLGFWDVEVEIGDTTFKAISAFRIDSISYPKFKTELIGPSAIRIDRWTDFNLHVFNEGNINAAAVTVWLAVPNNMLVDLGFNFEIPPVDSVCDWDTIPAYFEVDTLFDIIDNYKVYSFILPYVSAQSFETLPIKFRRNTNQEFSVVHWASRPFFLNDSIQLFRLTTSSGCFIDPDKLDCITGGIPFAPPLHSCLASFIGANLAIFNNATCDDYTNNTVLENIKNNYWLLTRAAIACLASGIPIANKMAMSRESLRNALSGAEKGENKIACVKGLWNSVVNANNITPIGSVDPNEKYGNSGALNSPYISSQFPINYSLHYENVDTATAPAQTVILIDTLDKTNLDLRSFQLTSIGFADTIIPIPPGRKSFTVNINMQPIPLIAQLTAYLNDTTGILTVVCRSLDPTNLEPTDSISLGFLLPNDSTGRGEGFVSFSILTDSSIANGSVVNNKADIFFDENAPITTPTWTNIIDNLKPQGQVISAIQILSTDSLNVAWASTDNGPSGVYVHNVYYNINGGEWLLWKYNTSLTSDIFVGDMDSTYGFYSIAIDSAYNIEEDLLTADVTTTLTVGIRDVLPSQIQVKLFPNPASKSVSIFIKLLNKGKSDYNIIARDIAGRTVRNESINIATESKTVEFDISQLVSGIYFFEITDGTNRAFEKLIKN